MCRYEHPSRLTFFRPTIVVRPARAPHHHSLSAIPFIPHPTGRVAQTFTKRAQRPTVIQLKIKSVTTTRNRQREGIEAHTPIFSMPSTHFALTHSYLAGHKIKPADFVTNPPASSIQDPPITSATNQIHSPQERYPASTITRQGYRNRTHANLGGGILVGTALWMSKRPLTVSRSGAL